MNIKPIKVTRTFCYSPEMYLEWCEEEGTPPTQEGFLEFVSNWIFDDFESCVDDLGELNIEEMEE